MAGELKSALELALEKLDSEEEVRLLSEEQKQKIGEVRAMYRSRVAENEIDIQGRIRNAAARGNFDEVESLQKQLVALRKRLEGEMEDQVAKIREEHS